MRGKRISYSEAEMAWLEVNRMMVISDYHRAFLAAFARPDVTATQLHDLRKRKGWKVGRTGQFETNSKPWNTGKKGCPPGAEKGWFKKGGLPPNTKFAGHERVNRDGYIEVSVEETNPHTGFERRYVHKHVWLWEQANGPVPNGLVLKCIDGDKANSDPANWTPVSRGVLARLNGGPRKKRPAYDQAAPALKPTLLVLAKVEDRASQLRRRKGAP